LVLFADSSNANLGVLREVKGIPTRLLLIGLPLTIAAGFAVGVLTFDQLTFIEIALLATMLAPTDAALGQAVVTNESVPDSVRESLNVESGLNDGICVPVLLIFSRSLREIPQVMKLRKWFLRCLPRRSGLAPAWVLCWHSPAASLSGFAVPGDGSAGPGLGYRSRHWPCFVLHSPSGWAVVGLSVRLLAACCLAV
jgi:hypothetical protein